jgi:hypothetical protein
MGITGNTYKVLVRKSERKRMLLRTTHIRNINIKIKLKETRHILWCWTLYASSSETSALCF